MTETGIILPWWFVSLVAGVLMTVAVWQRQQIRRACWQMLGTAVAVLDRWRERCIRGVALWQERADKAFSVFTEHLAATRYRLAMVDYMQLLTRRWQIVEAVCRDSDALIARGYHELEAAHMEKPEAPEWVVAADAIGGLPGGNSQPATAKILEAMLEAAESHHAEAMREFRWAAALRGRALLASARYWRQLKQRLGAIEEYGRALKAGEQTLAKASARMEVLHQRPARRRLLSGLSTGLGMTLLLALGAWFSIYLLVEQQRLVDVLVSHSVMAPSWSAIWPTLYLIVILLLGAAVACCVRISMIFPRISELGFRWRVRLGLLCAVMLILLSVGGMHGIATDMNKALRSAQWGGFSAGLASGLLYLVPLFLSAQLCVLANWLRASQPLTFMALEYCLRASERLLALFSRLLNGLRKHIHVGVSEKTEEPATTGAEGIKLVTDNSNAKAG